jgi:hypothetical protein
MPCLRHLLLLYDTGSTGERWLRGETRISVCHWHGFARYSNEAQLSLVTRPIVGLFSKPSVRARLTPCPTGALAGSRWGLTVSRPHHYLLSQGLQPFTSRPYRLWGHTTPPAANAASSLQRPVAPHYPRLALLRVVLCGCHTAPSPSSPSSPQGPLWPLAVRPYHWPPPGLPFIFPFHHYLSASCTPHHLFNLTLPLLTWGFVTLFQGGPTCGGHPPYSTRSGSLALPSVDSFVRLGSVVGGDPS